MIRAAGLLALALAACSGDDDPCAGVATCLRLDVHSASVTTIDQLELDILYGARHATTTTEAAGGHTTQLPLSTAIVLDLPGSAPLAIGVVAAGKLGATVRGTGAATAMLAPGDHATIELELAPVAACTAGAFYCGGDRLAGDPSTLYECNAGGVPHARGRCAGGCVVNPAMDDACAGVGGSCLDGSAYCGGDKLAGDPQTLYTCSAGVGTLPVRCAAACVVRPGSDDVCQ